jgi:hypothetical protein
MSPTTRRMLTALIVAAFPVTLAADTLYLRNGTRAEGRLIAVRADTIEFEEQRLFGGSRTIRVDRNDVDRVDFDRYSSGGSNGWNGGGGGWNGGGSGGRPSGMRERHVTVSAAEPWSDTGIELRSGQSIYIEASGQVRWGRDRRDGPDGEKNSPYNAARPLPNRPAAALIGRIGGDTFFIGDDTGPIHIRSRGRLELGINDEYLQDNSGSFRVTVFY